MRGLPPPPDDVALFRMTTAVDGAYGSVGFWIFMPGLGTALEADVAATFGNFVLYGVPFITNVTTHGLSVVTCRLNTYGINRLDLVTAPGPNAGGWGGAQAALVASCVHWQTGEAGSRNGARTFVPGFPDDFTDDHLRVNALGRANITNAAANWYAGVQASPVGTVTSAVLGTLHRQRGGSPSPAAVFAPYVAWTAAPLIARCSRRMLKRS